MVEMEKLLGEGDEQNTSRHVHRMRNQQAHIVCKPLTKVTSARVNVCADSSSLRSVRLSEEVF